MIKTFLRGQHFKNVSGFTVHILYHHIVYCLLPSQSFR